MDLFTLFSCQLHHIAFDGLISNTPFPGPTSQLINISLKFHCVLFVLDFTIANKVLFQTQCLSRYCLCTKRTTRDQERWPVGQPTKLEPNQILCLATNSITKQFAFKEFMRGCIKCLFKIQYKCVNLSFIV